MRLHLERFAYTPIGTLGRLFVGDSTLFTVERPWLGNKPFSSCIPPGHYQCQRYSSPKYPDTWEIVGVPERSLILFHVANFPHEVQGCIGLGTSMMGERVAVAHSGDAVEKFRELTAGTEHLELTIGQFLPEYP